MLINLTETKFEQINNGKIDYLAEKYGSILDFSLPNNYMHEEIETVAESVFVRIATALDTCANEPKKNIVCINDNTKLEKIIIDMLILSDIEILSDCL